MKYLLGIDFGGGSSKATLLGENGQIAAEHSEEYRTFYPSLGACEQEPEDWIKALVADIRAILGKGFSPRDIAAIAIDSATHTAVLCDSDCRPLRRAIHWTDSRARSEAKELRDNFGERIFDITFHKPDTIWTLPQLLWVRHNEPEIFCRIQKIFFEKDYIRYRLTGKYVTDFIEAEGSMFFDCVNHEWSKALCSLIGLDADILPPVVSPTDIIGGITDEAAQLTGLLAGTPVICGTTDTAMEIFASGAVKKGDMTVKLATAGRICVITDRPYPDRDLVNYSHIVEGLWYPGTATKAAASSLRWYRDTFGGNYRELDETAAEIPIGSEGLYYHPYLNGELTPYADPTLSGSFVGFRATHGKAHFTRSVLEGVAFSLLHSKLALERIGVPLTDSATLIGGGSKSSLWSKITADCLGMTLNITESSDSSLGSAMLAGVAVGLFASPADAADKCIHRRATIIPEPENTEKYRKFFDTYVKIHDALAPIYHGGIV